MQLGMGTLALACLALGVGASLILPGLGTVLAGVGGLPESPVSAVPRLTLEVSGAVGAIAPAALAAGLVLVPAAVVLAFRLGAADRRLRVGDTWGCGRIGQTPRMEYTATAFAEPLRRIFAELYRPTEDLSIDFHPESRYFVQAIAYRSEVDPWIERLLYAPLVAGAAPRSRAGRIDPLDEGAAAEPAWGATLAAVSRPAQALPERGDRLHQRLLALPGRAVRRLLRHGGGRPPPSTRGGTSSSSCTSSFWGRSSWRWRVSTLAPRSAAWGRAAR
jgi:hypothetical protein